MTPTEITVFEKSGGPLTKRIALCDGKIVNDSANCRMISGSAHRVRIDSMQALADLINGFTSRQVYALGRLRDDLPDQVRVVRKQDLNGGMGVIVRSLDFLGFGEGKPGLALLDFDTKAMPDHLCANMAYSGVFWMALLEVLPAIDAVAWVSRNSTSSGLSHRETGQTFPGSGGQHLVVPVADAADIPRLLSDLHDRFWLRGWGWGMVGAAGQFLERSIIDKAVGSPERLIFEGAPIIGPPLEQSGREAEAHDGDVLDTRLACPPLSTAEKEMVRKLVEAEKHRLLPQMQAARAKWSEVHVSRLVALGTPEIEARIVVGRWIDRKELGGPFPLPFDDAAIAGKTVTEVLIAPERYIGKTMSDPFEGPSYGRGKAILYRRDDGSLFIHSFAHGSMTYELRGKAAALELLWGDTAAMPQAMGTIVKGILHASSLTLVYGPPKSGKSFLVTDSFVAIADENRTEWMGHAIMRHGPVLYIACEGHAGFWKRLAALKLDPGMSLPANFALARGRPVLIHLDPKSHQAIPHPDDILDAVAHMTAGSKKPVAVAIDTVFRSVGGGNVSAADHMNAYLTALAAIQDQGIALVVVHHEVKAGGTPAGSVTLIGGSDTIISTKRQPKSDGGGCTWKVEMAKDDAETEERAFRLEMVNVGTDAEGEAGQTSCVVRDCSAMTGGAAARAVKEKLSKSERVAMSALEEAIGEAGADLTKDGLPPGAKAVTIDCWRKKAYQRGISEGEQGAKQRAFNRAFTSLNAGRFIGVADPYVWIAD